MFFERKPYRANVRKLHADHITYGFGSAALAKMHNLSQRRVEAILLSTPAVLNIGPAPEECRLGVYSGFKAIIEPVLKDHGINWAVYMGNSRRDAASRCRWETWAALNDAGKSYALIGRFCGRDHTTIRHGALRHRGLL